MKDKNFPHISSTTTGQEVTFNCANCKDREVLQLPMALSQLPKEIKRFTKMHKD